MFLFQAVLFPKRSVFKLQDRKLDNLRNNNEHRYKRSVTIEVICLWALTTWASSLRPEQTEFFFLYNSCFCFGTIVKCRSTRGENFNLRYVPPRKRRVKGNDNFRLSSISFYFRYFSTVPLQSRVCAKLTRFWYTVQTKHRGIQVLPIFFFNYTSLIAFFLNQGKHTELQHKDEVLILKTFTQFLHGFFNYVIKGTCLASTMLKRLRNRNTIVKCRQNNEQGPKEDIFIVIWRPVLAFFFFFCHPKCCIWHPIFIVKCWWETFFDDSYIFLFVQNQALSSTCKFNHKLTDMLTAEFRRWIGSNLHSSKRNPCEKEANSFLRECKEVKV